MRILVYGGLILAVLAVIAGVVLVVRKKKFALLYCSIAFLLVMILMWYVMPVTRFLQYTPNDQVEYVHLDVIQFGNPTVGASQAVALSGEEKAEFLAALRETGFYHEGNYSNTYVSGELYYYGRVYANGKHLSIHVHTYPDGGADAYVNTDAPWRYHADDAAPLAQVVERIMGK